MRKVGYLWGRWGKQEEEKRNEKTGAYAKDQS